VTPFYWASWYWTAALKNELVIIIPYFFDTNVIVSFVFSEYEKTGKCATKLMQSNEDIYIGKTV